ncbi:hypothetical protein VNI00_016296 [Paramarasmius palmivorus]|uniref:Uncharacterized protein n=1 Tax=Paramarasmius palmivorus TaxID=297713 RepID=A0AAW0BFB8_9AGAR
MLSTLNARTQIHVHTVSTTGHSDCGSVNDHQMDYSKRLRGTHDTEAGFTHHDTVFPRTDLDERTTGAALQDDGSPTSLIAHRSFPLPHKKQHDKLEKGKLKA